MEPAKEKTISAIIPVKNINGLDSKVHAHFGRAPYYLMLKFDNTNIKIEDFYYNQFLDEKQHIGLKVIKAVINHKLDLLFTSQIGEISFHMLKNNFVDIFKANEDLSVKEIVERYHNQDLDPITEPTHSMEDAQISR